jgi:hypothetical protein
MVEALTEKLALVGYVSSSYGFAASSKQTATIDMDVFRRAMIILQGKVSSTVATTNGGLVLKIFDATNTGKCASTAIITMTGLQLTTTTRAYQCIAEIRSEQLGKKTARPGTGRFFRARVINGTLKAIANVIVLGDTARYGPASDYDLATVAEIETDSD